MTRNIDREASSGGVGITRILAGTLLALGIAAGTTAASAATLIGNEIQATYLFPTLDDDYPFATVTPNPFIVGAGVEATIDVEGVTFLQIDFSANSLVITMNTVLATPTWSDAAQNGPSFKVLSGNPFPQIGPVVASNAGPVTAFLLGGELIVDWGGMSYRDGDTVTIGLVPLPASAGVLALGLGALGWVSRRRRAA